MFGRRICRAYLRTHGVIRAWRPVREPALTRIRGLYEAIARIPQITGICYTQLYDVEQEINGLMTYDRRMKFDPAVIRRDQLVASLITGS